ncbi:uncharacterized protein LOC131957878 isoform X2 [Physella acuta]|uniref:uncharacterized protein LOC131957878 isoform X2 n=1 Tax=Physella acuta TaxID=109671 RepID=UPI0027DBB339|nr:uncharacterized protein LOC131957878 isoform X2 [Physella acuta]
MSSTGFCTLFLLVVSFAGVPLISSVKTTHQTSAQMTNRTSVQMTTRTSVPMTTQTSLQMTNMTSLQTTNQTLVQSNNDTLDETTNHTTMKPIMTMDEHIANIGNLTRERDRIEDVNPEPHELDMLLTPEQEKAYQPPPTKNYTREEQK